MQGNPGVSELRLALAMRGGVSLSVWIGGSCAEIDQLRTARAVDPQGFWSRLLEKAHYERVAVDILAGASAGGLNGVIYAASQQYGFSMQGLRTVWVEVGDTANLLRRKGDGKPAWPSLFLGDGYFYAETRKQLKSLADGVVPPVEPAPVLLTLSATLVEPIRRAVSSPQDESLSNLRFGSGFTFRHPRYPWQHSDFSPSAGLSDRVASRLALAARSTSSFPVAFEAANVRSVRPVSFGEGADDRSGGLDVDMGGVFLDRGTPADSSDGFTVSDGGILDNIPLGRALQAIADAPADGPTDRYLIYIQPGAVTAPREEPATAQATEGEKSRGLARRDALSVLRGLLTARVPSEDIVGDLQQLDEYNTRIERARSMRRATFQGPHDQAGLVAAARAYWPSYRLFRADEDQRLICALLDDPLRALGEDPFPTHVGTEPVSESVWRAPLDAPRPGAARPDFTREKLAAILVGRFRDRVPELLSGQPLPPVTTVGSLPLLRICQLLIEWAQSVEARPGVSGGSAEGSALKAQAYEIAAFVRAAIDRPRRLGWVTLAATAPPEVDAAGLAEASAKLTALAMTTPEQAGDLVKALRADATSPERDEVLRGAVQERVARLDLLPSWAWGLPAPDRLAALHASADAEVVDLRTCIVEELLLPLARKLAALAPREVPGDREHGNLGRILHGASVSRETLEALEVVAYPEFASGLPGRRPVRFRRLSAGNPTPLAPRFTKLIEVAQHDPRNALWWDPDERDPEAQQGIHLDLKLAGNELANFSAFLHADWRANDWMWGRLDAVPTLVDLLLSADGFTLGEAPSEEDVRELVAGSPGTPLREFLDDQQLLHADLVQQIRTELQQGPSPQLRRSLIAARQWEILRDELGVPAEALVRAVGQYRTGAETLQDPHLKDDVADRLDGIADVLGDLVVWTIQQHLGHLGSSDRRNLSAWGVDKAITFATKKTIDHLD